MTKVSKPRTRLEVSEDLHIASALSGEALTLTPQIDLRIEFDFDAPAQALRHLERVYEEARKQLQAMVNDRDQLATHG